MLSDRASFEGKKEEEKARKYLELNTTQKALHPLGTLAFSPFYSDEASKRS